MSCSECTQSVGLAIAAARDEIEKIWSLERKDQKESCIRPYAKRAAERTKSGERPESGKRKCQDAPLLAAIEEPPVVRAEGLEPSQGLRPNGFSYPYDFRRLAGKRVRGTLRQVCGLDYTFTLTVRSVAVRR
jgi:hypothetical protein